MKSNLLFLCLLFTVSVYGQNLVQSGPMLGYSDHREVALWIQTKAEATVQFRFWDLENPTAKRRTESVKTEKKNAFAFEIHADSLLPGKKYQYEVLINGKTQKFDYPLQFQTLALWQFRTDPPAFTVAVGSCAYVNEPFWDRPGRGYGDSMMVFKTLHEQKPDLMLWLGDNTYTREGDWNTKSGFQHRYTHTRSLPEMQPLLASTHHYATWDDHDYGPNDGDRSFWNKEMASETFDLFWANPNGKPLGKGSVVNTFGWGDCQVFMLDDRWFRAPNNSKDSTRAFFGEEQINWLIDALTYSKANFKIITCGGQVINDARMFENYAVYPVERRKLIDRITAAGISGVFFLSGDRHHAELSKLERLGTYPLYDLTTSPLTAGTHNPGNEPNTLRVPGTLYNGRNFALLKLSGPAKDRVMKVQVMSNLGRLIWEKDFKASELK
ncbi:MAG TPA: alkaline phosphatase D family protein [Catalimonadaceae bacterium]|nr:alkaline phosphatase D family protein [Catalimonadaceae bacterium]